MKKYFLFLVLIIILGCAPAVSIKKIYQSGTFQVGNLSSSKIRLYISNNVNVMEFVKTFKSEYQSVDNFISSYENEIIAKITEKMPQAILNKGNPADIEYLISGVSLSDEKINIMKEIFNKSDEEYFFIIKNITINNVTTSSGVQMAGGRGGAAVGISSAGEDCVVTTLSEIWKVKDKSKVLEFEAIGKKAVAFPLPPLFKKALVEAVKESIIHTVNYISGAEGVL